MNKLNNLRQQIDKIDQKLIETLYKRFLVVAKIGKLKKDIGLPPLDMKRWEKVLQSRILMGKKLRLSEKLIKTIYEAIHKYSLEIEK